MGITKTDLFTEEQNSLARTFKALAHPARIAILQHLIEVNACINSDLVHELGLAQATISQHLRELKELGLIQGNISGTSMNYCINSEKWFELREELSDFFEKVPRPNRFDCCQ
ncbi:MAG: ArsR family transcriptional regulator [Bacteroidetes bacterium]|nr:MAG: ArsR family transcriptional regulator [Bacteroidota bacterium]